MAPGEPGHGCMPHSRAPCQAPPRTRHPLVLSRLPHTQAADRQGGELADAQRQVQLLEAEVEGKAREGNALLADTLDLKASAPAWQPRPVLHCNASIDALVSCPSLAHAALPLPSTTYPSPPSHPPLQRQLQEAQDGLHSAADSHSQQHAALASRVREAERALAGCQAETKAEREQAAALQALVVEKERGLGEQAGALQRLDQQRIKAEAAAAELAEQLGAAQRQGREAAAVAEQAQARMAGRVQQLEAQLAAAAEARQLAQQAAAAAKEAVADEQKRHALEGSAWERRLREQQQDAAERLQRREEAWAGQREAAQREAAAAAEEARRQLTKRLYLAEGKWARKLQHCSADWGERAAGAMVQQAPASAWRCGQALSASTCSALSVGSPQLPSWMQQAPTGCGAATPTRRPGRRSGAGCRRRWRAGWRRRSRPERRLWRR